VQTAPFALAIDLPAPPAGQTDSYPPTSFWVPLRFNNLVDDARADVAQGIDPKKKLMNTLGPHVQVRQAGRLLDSSEYQLQPDAVDPTLVFIRPTAVVRAQPGADGAPVTNPIWDSGARIDVSVDGDVADIYGATLGAAVSASFVACERVGAVS